MLVRLSWQLMLLALAAFALAYEFREFGWEGIGPPIVGCLIALPFVVWRIRRRG
jgi:hypothetical protein